MYGYKSLIIKNRSYRSFDPAISVKREELLEMIDCARLSASGGNRQALKFRICLEEDEVGFMHANTKMGAALPELTLPPKGHEPKAYIVICVDSELSMSGDISMIDVGIAAEAITLAASDLGLGGCMIRMFSADEVKKGLALPENLNPELVIAVGCPDEFSFITNLPEDGLTKYFRDDKGVHFVPKRSISDIVI